ncbi:MAG: penicillin acylase family protein [Sandaracinaceae bacterium]|nr:penicillin acylase family protein [Sandaracinaceae bacterium]
MTTGSCRSTRTTPSTRRATSTRQPRAHRSAAHRAGGGRRPLVTASLPMNAPWEDLQFRIVGDERIPSTGWTESSGSARVHARGRSGLHPDWRKQLHAGGDVGQREPRGLCAAVLAQSSDPASPFYADQTRAYSEGTWPEFPFCDAEVRAAQVTREVLVGP